MATRENTTWPHARTTSWPLTTRNPAYDQGMRRPLAGAQAVEPVLPACALVHNTHVRRAESCQWLTASAMRDANRRNTRGTGPVMVPPMKHHRIGDN